MSAAYLAATTLVLAAVGFLLARRRAIASVGGDARKLHSLPAYYGWNVALFTFLPAMALLILWLIVQPVVINGRVAPTLPDDLVTENSRDLIMSDVRRVASGLDLAVVAGVMTKDAARAVGTKTSDLRDRLAEIGVALGADIDPGTLHAAQLYRSMSGVGNSLRSVLVLLVAASGFAYAFRQTGGNYRARNTVERVILVLLGAAASIAILTTLGIVLSLAFNTMEFFKLYPWQDFFFGLTWAPSFGGGSQLGILPLIWGTLYISVIALLVAVPIGLFAAIYLSEYASPPLRAIAKPLLEILAGIPTIVYGMFALLTIGPMLMKLFGDGGFIGVDWMSGGRAVITAGLVMGIMLIPFVSSLSDDIINSVPQSLRDGSLGLGATNAETVRQVVLPAALPGIVGAILLAASRAIGETMIVVLGAGAAAQIKANPFESMTTVTTRIVSQLTGDADFSSPEALVAFALGMTLFVMTLGLNIVALYIVNKYREHYE